MTAPNDTVSIARSTSGPAGNASGAAAIFAVIATAAAGPTATPFLARNDADPSAIHTGGALPEVAEIISSYSRAATIPVRAASAVVGDVLDIDVSDFTGTAVPGVSATLVPYINAEVIVDFPTGGTLGVAADGITYRTSRDAGHSWSAPQALGAATFIDVPVVNARIVLEPPSAQVTQLVTYANANRTAFLAHIIYTTGTVHGAADSTSDDAIQIAATNTATAITLLATLVAGLSLHMLRGSTVHLVTQSGASVTAALAAVVAASAAATASGTAQDAISGFVAFEAALEAHEASTVAHTIADAVNVVVATVPTRGTVIADDAIAVDTTGPTMDAAGLAACFAGTAGVGGLVRFQLSKFGGVVVAGAFDPAVLWSALIAGLDLLRSSQVPVIAIIEARPPTDAETDTQYRIALEAEWAAYHDERVYVCAGRHGRYDPATLARTGAQLLRSHLAPLAARLAALDYGESPGVVRAADRLTTGPSAFGGPLAGYRIYDDAGARIGHDERTAPGLQPAGFGVLATFPNAADPMKPYSFEPLTRAPTGNLAPHITHQRVLNVIEGVIFAELTNEIQAGLLYEPGRDTIRADIADSLDAQLANRVLAETGDPAQTKSARISRLSVAVDRNAAINPANPEVPVYVEVDTRFYVSEFPVQLNVNRLG